MDRRVYRLIQFEENRTNRSQFLYDGRELMCNAIYDQIEGPVSNYTWRDPYARFQDTAQYRNDFSDALKYSGKTEIKDPLFPIEFIPDKLFPKLPEKKATKPAPVKPGDFYKPGRRKIKTD